MLEPLLPTRMGTEANYTLRLRNARETFLPLTIRGMRFGGALGLGKAQENP